MNENQEAGNGNQEGAVLLAQDLELERVVKGTIGRELDLQRGRAGAAFARMMASRGTEHAGSMQDDGVAGRIEQAREVRRLRFWAGAASAMAACLAVVVGVQALRPKTVVVDRAGGHASTPVMEQVEMTRNVDGGTIVWDDQPVHVVRQQTVKRTQWFDPQEKATYSVTEPVEKVGYERLRPY